MLVVYIDSPRDAEKLERIRGWYSNEGQPFSQTPPMRPELEYLADRCEQDGKTACANLVRRFL